MTKLEAAWTAFYTTYLKGVDPSKILPPLAGQWIVGIPSLYEAHFPTWLFAVLTVSFVAFTLWGVLVYPKTTLQMSADLKAKAAAGMTVLNEVIGNVAGKEAAEMAVQVEGVMTPLVDKVLTTDATTQTTVTASVTDAPPTVTEVSSGTTFAAKQQAESDAMMPPAMLTPEPAVVDDPAPTQQPAAAPAAPVTIETDIAHMIGQPVTVTTPAGTWTVPIKKITTPAA